MCNPTPNYVALKKGAPQIVRLHAWKFYKVRNLFIGAISKRDISDLSRKHMLTMIPHFAGFFQ